MTLSSGTQLGPYEVLTPLGAGGMGEVYRARDTRLDREVAIKVLPAELASDASRLKRFEKEARSASALNHPNIVTIHDIGSSDGLSWIAMEKIEGQTLRKLLLGGAIPPKKLLPLATQIADGLTQAHEAGIVHRDLKPENVMITRDGVVKILDFGVAKLADLAPDVGPNSQATTETKTRPGLLVGTVGYMSPEQAAGIPVDFRSDQFSFGSVLYEMATGKRAFSRRTPIDTLAAILNDEPEPIGSGNPHVPAPLRWVIERCLAKDPRGRYAATRDLACELATVRDHSTEAVAATVARPARRPAVAALLAGLALLGVVGGALFLPRLRGRKPTAYQQLTFRRGTILPARFAPDGHTVLYSATFDGESWRVYSVRPERPESSAIALAPARLAAVSRSGDLAILLGSEIGGTTLARVSLSGGAPRALLDDARMADWSPDGAQLAVVHEVGGRSRVEFPAGNVLYESTGHVEGLRVSPRGDLVAFSDLPHVGDSIGSLLVVDQSARSRILSSGWYDLGQLAWSPDGSEVWFAASRSGSRRSLWAVTLAGRERLVASTPGSVELEDISPSGAALVSQESNRRSITGLAPGEKSERSYSWLDYSEPVELSRDGKTLLFQEWGEGGGPSGAIYLRRFDGSDPVRLGDGLALSLSPDGRTVLARLYTKPPRLALVPTGSGQSRLVPGQGLNYEECGKWLPDGKRIVFAAREANRGGRLYLQNLDGGEATALTPEGIRAANLQCAAVAPDGELVAALDAQDRMQLFPTSPGASRPALGVEPGEHLVRWSGDDRFLYVARGSKVYRVDPFRGRRELWRDFKPPDPAGVRLDSFFVVLSAGGESYFYSFQTQLSELYLVHGLR